MNNKYSSNNFSEDDKGILMASVNFNIRIYNPAFEYWQYRDALNNAMILEVKHRPLDTGIQSGENPFEMFLRTRVKALNNREKATFLITDYAEAEGSLVITFSIIVFNTLMNYGQLRDTFDRLRSDLEYFTRGAFPTNTMVEIEYDDQFSHHLKTISYETFNQSIGRLNHEIKSLKLIGLIAGMLAFGFYIFSQYKDISTSNQPIDSTIVSSLIRTELQKIEAEKTNEDILTLLKQLKRDSTNARRIP